MVLVAIRNYRHSTVTIYYYTFDRYHHQQYPTTSLYHHRFSVPYSSIPQQQQQQQQQIVAAPSSASSSRIRPDNYDSRQRAVINGSVITATVSAPDTASTGPYFPYQSVYIGYLINFGDSLVYTVF